MRPEIEAVRPGTHLEAQGAFAEPQEKRGRRGVGEDEWVRSCDLEQDLEHLLRGCSVGDSHAHVDAAQAVRQRPVGDLLADHARVGDDDFGALARAYGAGAHAELLDLARDVADLDGIAHVDPSLEQDEQPRDEVVHDGLEPEANPDAERTGQDGELGEIDAQRRQRQ